MSPLKLRQSWLRSILAIVWPAFGAHAAWAGSKPDSQDAEGLLRSGHFTEAEAAFMSTAVSKSSHANTLLRLGYLALLRNDLDTAERRLQTVLAVKPKIEHGPALLAETYYRRDDFACAASLFKKAGQTAKASKLASFASQKPNQIEGASSVASLPFLKTDPLPIVSLRVNDSEPARFLIDTGGGELILDRAFAEKVSATRFGRERSIFGGGRQATVEHARVESVQLGDLLVRRVPIVTMDLAAIGRALGETRIDGILGTVLLYHFQSTIDYENGQLILAPRGSGQVGQSPTEGMGPGIVDVPFWMAEDHFIVARGAANRGNEMLYFVDTGLAGAGFTCPPTTAKDSNITLKTNQATTGIGGGGTMQLVPLIVTELRLGDVRRTQIDGSLGAFPPQLEWDLGFHIGGLISHQFFRPGALTLDFDSMHLRIRSSSQTPRSKHANEKSL